MYQVHNRFAIFNQGQHIYRHTLSDFQYYNPALPENITNVELAMNWILAVLYPQTQAAVADVASLPLVGNTLNDYRVVQDDGDGKAASYRWEQRDGDVSPKWYKVYDMDWGADSILQAFMNKTQDLYVHKYGRTDIDETGTPVAGVFAGQRIFGGNLTGQNLTLDANSADSTGYVQTNNNFRPTQDATFDLGAATYKFYDGYFSHELYVSTLSFATGSITDSTGTIDFNDENLITTGDIDAANFTASSNFYVGTLQIADGSITDSDGTISFGTTNITTTGTITGAVNSQLADFTFANGSLTSATATINFNTNNLLTTGTIQGGDATVTRVNVDNLRLDGNTLSATNLNGGIIITANGTGVVDVQSAITSLGITATGTVGVTGQLNIDNIRIDGNVISSTDLNGNISLSPNGSGEVVFSGILRPSTDNLIDLGLTANRIRTLYIGTSISDGTTSISSATLQSLRDINTGVAAGMSLFYDGSKWVASAPDTEITHSGLTGLTTGDAGHTQFALLAGRAGGQSLIGGTAASEDLVLESTANASKGFIKFKDDIAPNATAAYSGGWSGVDIGSSSLYFNDLYTKGELKGARLQGFAFASLPANSSQNVGRTVWGTDTNLVYVDTGSAWKQIGQNKYLNDESFNGSDTSKTVTVSASISDARRAIWALHDNANDFERIYCTIKAISATQVTITTTVALPAGSYRLIGIE